MMMIVIKMISFFLVRSSWHICRDKVSGSCLEVKRTTSISLSGEMLCCRSSAAKNNQHRNKYCWRTFTRHCIESPGCRVLFRCLGPLSARSSTPPSTMGLCWLLHQVFSQLSRSCYNAISSIFLKLSAILLLSILIVRQQPAPCCHHWGPKPCSEAW